MTVAQRKAQKRLREELEKVSRAVSELKHADRPQELEGFGDNTPLSEDIDAIHSAEMKENNALRLQQLLDRAAALDAALRRAERRAYGKCVDCGGEIDPKRLESVPEAARCLECQEDYERRSPGSRRTARWAEASDLYEKKAAYDTEGFPRRADSVEEAEGLSVERDVDQ